MMFLQKSLISLAISASIAFAEADGNGTRDSIVFDPLQYVDPLIGTAKDGVFSTSRGKSVLIKLQDMYLEEPVSRMGWQRPWRMLTETTTKEVS